MAPYDSLLHGDVHPDHIVHFFDDDAARVQGIAAYVLAALREDHRVMVVARPSVWVRIAAMLTAHGIQPFTDARLVAVDATQMLAGLLRHGHIDPEIFRRTIVPAVKDMAEQAPAGLSACGEMVDLLASEHNFAAALELEVAWNQLAAEVPIRLFCGYSAAHFAAKEHRGAMLDICAEHSQIRTDSTDSLGRWLVGTNGTGV